jgi:chromosome partitioning protein
MIISILNPKGGSGKSTLAVNLARSLQMDGERVLIGDLDKQGTVSTWRSVAPDADFPPVVFVGERVLELPNINGFDFIILDGLAQQSPINTKAVTISDVVLCPVAPSVGDLWALRPFLEEIPKRRALLVLNRATRTTFTESVIDALPAFGVTVLDVQIRQRTAYVEAMADGQTVFETRDRKAQAEIENLKNQITQWLSATYPAL